MEVKENNKDQPHLLSRVLECYSEVRCLSLWTPRPSVKGFCDINSEGCAKLREIKRRGPEFNASGRPARAA